VASNRRLLLLIVLIPVALVLGLPAAAQEAPSVADPTAAYLPAPAALGDGWSLVRTGSLELPTEMFRAGNLGVFVGPAGARILAAVMLVTESRVAVRRSWEEATDLFRKYSGELAYDSDRDDILDRLPPPSGCVEAKRIDGTARQLGLDVILLVLVSGAVHSLTGYEASDAIASLMLGATGPSGAATPAAG
jgi:hypothetical protein